MPRQKSVEEELNNAVVKRLLNRLAERDHTITHLTRWIVVLLAICLGLLALGSTRDGTGPEHSGAAHVDGRG